jgi:hypothetical protein
MRLLKGKGSAFDARLMTLILGPPQPDSAAIQAYVKAREKIPTIIKQRTARIISPPL